MDQTADVSFLSTKDHVSSIISKKEDILQQKRLVDSTIGESISNGAPREGYRGRRRSLTFPSSHETEEQNRTHREEALESQEENVVIAPVFMLDCEAAEDSSSQTSKSATRNALEIEVVSDGSLPATQTQNALVRKLRIIRDQRRRLSARQRVAIVIGMLPVAICSLEMIPDRCRICRKDVQMDAYIFTAAICGGFGAVIYGSSLDYWMPRLVGGASAALGSLFTNWMVLTSIPAKWSFLLLFFGILGAMPGVVIYFTLKIVADECFENSDEDLEEEYEEIAPLTKIRIVQGD